MKPCGVRNAYVEFDDFLTHTVQMKQKIKLYIQITTKNFLTHTVQMKPKNKQQTKKPIYTS